MVLRDGELLLSRLAPYLSESPRWTLPGGGIDFGEHPRDAVVREVHEETGLDVTVSDEAWIDSARRHATVSDTDMHSVRIVYEGWVAPDAPEPRVVEVDGSTVDAAWHPLADVVSGRVETVPMVRWALDQHATARLQRVAAYALVVRTHDGADEVLLTRNSARGPHPGRWALPGGGVDHGEPPARTVARELREETGLDGEVGRLVGVHDEHFTGTAPSGREEDFHGVQLLFEVTATGDPEVRDTDGTTDAAAWVPVEQVRSGALEVAELVRTALDHRAR
ncbi:ADP-ribose pyrophosphatase YjhB, NUDIX family [Nocardioides scoriae]|uniref:ADP-ribose pyrophosphatase YjhB, NUDIX family n=1 Tax=Nocardioides scoriae TaxID=642780 RepID=A0A1H1TDE1_9ACTN|nr:ADP-ribose pyrophosphatase YjhB, NUDIX family [Nocardioides scoriae]